MSLQELGLQKHAIVQSSKGAVCYQLNELDPYYWFHHKGYSNGDCASVGFSVNQGQYYSKAVDHNDAVEYYSTLIKDTSGTPLCH